MGAETDKNPASRRHHQILHRKLNQIIRTKLCYPILIRVGHPNKSKYPSNLPSTAQFPQLTTNDKPGHDGWACSSSHLGCRTLPILIRCRTSFVFHECAKTMSLRLRHWYFSTRLSLYRFLFLLHANVSYIPNSFYSLPSLRE